MKIDLAEIKRIAGRSSDLNGEFNAQFSSMSKTLEDICVNVQSSELTEANKNLVASINSLQDRIKNNLPQIIDFLNRQVASYENTNATTQSSLSNLASTISSNLQ